MEDIGQISPLWHSYTNSVFTRPLLFVLDMRNNMFIL